MRATRPASRLLTALVMIAACNPPAWSGGVVMREAIPPPVEKDELAPVMATDGSGLPYELWRGLSTDKLEGLISELDIPPRSPALHQLWKRLISADVTPPSGTAANARFTALRLEALYRSGLAKEAAGELAKQPAANDALFAMLAARNQLASGESDKACQSLVQAAAGTAQLPKRLKAQAVLLTGYCAVKADDTAGAGLAAELAREEGLENSPGLDALDAISIGAKPKLTAPKELSLLDYRIVERIGRLPHGEVVGKGEPALLVALSSDPATPIDLGMPAAEKAAQLNALSPELLAAIYRANAGNETPQALLSGSKLQGAFHRAALFKAAEAEQTPGIKARLMRALIDDARKAGMHWQALVILAPAAASLNPAADTAWFAETAAEIGLAAGRYDLVVKWVQPAANLNHWLALADIADAASRDRGAHLPALETLARAGRFTPEALHRLATVLDALGYNVPIPLWEAASRAPQPNTGFLPETGVLSELQDAAQKKEFGRTVLLVMKALGPNGAEGAHMIALGDSIRALRRAGLEADARRLGLEAMLGSWPRAASN